MAEPDPTARFIPRNPNLDREIPFKRFEYVDVTFDGLNTDLVIPYTLFVPDNVDDVRWLDVTPNTIYNGVTETAAMVYRSTMPSRLAWGNGFIALRSTVANYATRLLLFVER